MAIFEFVAFDDGGEYDAAEEHCVDVVSCLLNYGGFKNHLLTQHNASKCKTSIRHAGNFLVAVLQFSFKRTTTMMQDVPSPMSICKCQGMMAVDCQSPQSHQHSVNGAITVLTTVLVSCNTIMMAEIITAGDFAIRRHVHVSSHRNYHLQLRPSHSRTPPPSSIANTIHHPLTFPRDCPRCLLFRRRFVVVV